MLAYLFWHVPFQGIPLADYEAALLAFHRDLAGSAPPGMKGSAAFRISAVPWLAGPQVYEDWCYAASSAALDTLNQAAVQPSRWTVHADIAAKMDLGHGGLYYHLYGSELPAPGARVVWLKRPRGIRFEQPLQDIIARAADFTSCWRRQMVLGPGWEFALTGGPSLKVVAPEGWQSLAVERTFLGP